MENFTKRHKEIIFLYQILPSEKYFQIFIYRYKFDYLQQCNVCSIIEQMDFVCCTVILSAKQ